MFMEKIEQLVAMLEKQELEISISAPLYLELFSAYLYLNDLSNARFLWKRIPESVKNGNAELEQVYKVYSALWKNDTIEFYQTINYDWGKSTAELMFELKEKVQLQTVHQIGIAYTSIFENVFAEMTNQTPEMIEETCKNLNWEIQDGQAQNERMILPKKPVLEKISSLSAEDQLHKLTDFVSFLEN